MATQGPFLPGTGADDATVGTVTWTNPGNITANDASSATATLGAGAASHYLKATNFGFSIPGGATINGILVEWSEFASSGNCKDNSIKIVKGGVISGTEKSTGASWNNVAPQLNSYGSSSDLWGLAWTDTDINASTFGAVLSAIDAFAGSTASVNYMQITVTYTAVGGSFPTKMVMAQVPVHWCQIFE